MLEDDMLNEEFNKNYIKPKKTIREKSTFEVKQTQTENMLKLDNAQKNLVKIYNSQRRIPVRVAPAYARYFGRIMRVAINGIIISVKCDGNTVELPEDFAAEVYRRMSEMDKYDLRTSKMSQVERNLEQSPGQLNFFG